MSFAFTVAHEPPYGRLLIRSFNFVKVMLSYLHRDPE